MRHSKNKEGLHPIDLFSKLTKISGGINQKGDAFLIATDYQKELKKEQELANDLEIFDYQYPLNPDLGMRKSRSRGMEERTRSQHNQSTQHRSQSPQSRGNDLTGKIQSIVELMNFLDGDKRRHPRDDVMTKREFKEMLMKRKNKDLKKEVHEIRSEMRKLRREAQNQNPPRRSSYEQDEFLLLKEFLDSIKDTVENRDYVKEMIKEGYLKKKKSKKITSILVVMKVVSSLSDIAKSVINT